MNIGLLKQMLEQDPTITEDVNGFLTRVNEQNIKVVDKKTTTTEDVVSFISFAEQHGGKATQKDIDQALKQIAQEPLILKAQQNYEDTIAKIQTGEITSINEL